MPILSFSAAIIQRMKEDLDSNQDIDTGLEAAGVGMIITILGATGLAAAINYFVNCASRMPVSHCGQIIINAISGQLASK